MGSKVRVTHVDVDVIFTEAPDKVPRRLVKGEPVATMEGVSGLKREIFDRQSVEVQEKPGGGIIIKAWKTVENLRAFEVWRSILGKEIALDDKEQMKEFDDISTELHRTCLGRTLDNTLRLEWIRTPEDVAESIIAEQEFEADWHVLEKFLHYDERKHRFVWNPPIELLRQGEAMPYRKLCLKRDITVHSAT